MDVQMPQDGATSQFESQQQNSPSDQHQGTHDQAPSLTELDKLERFKYQGQEWTPKDLEKAILRQKDYTQKTQTLAEERKTLETLKSNEKFFKNLYADLRLVEKNKSLATEFLKLYPQEFHPYLKEVLQNASQAQMPGQATQSNEQSQQGPYIDFEARSEVQQLKSILQEQEVAKNQTEINSYINEFTSDLKGKSAEFVKKVAIANVYEAYNKMLADDPNAKLPKQVWQDAFKEVRAELEDVAKEKYTGLVKKQTSANAKGRDVDSGGGTPGRAPRKFKNLDEVRDFAIENLKSGGR